MFDEALCEQGRNFANKIWNSLRLIKGWEVSDTIEQPAHSKMAIAWFENRFNAELVEIEKQFAEFRISEALMSIYRLIWDSYCSWYLEIVKPAYQQPIDKKTYNSSIRLLENLMTVLHPFMPFLTEEVWHSIKERDAKDCVMVNDYPKTGSVNTELLNDFDTMTEVMVEIRTFRKKQNLAQKIPINLSMKLNEQHNEQLNAIIQKLGNIEALNTVSEKVEGAFSFIIKSNEFYIPLAGTVDVEEQKKKLEEELKYTKGFLNSVAKKLSNERFVNNAPESVVASEQKKQADAEQKIRVIEEQLAGLS